MLYNTPGPNKKPLTRIAQGPVFSYPIYQQMAFLVNWENEKPSVRDPG
jgi:hypothetical protein